MESNDLTPLIGSWRAKSVGLIWSDTGERIEPYGPSPEGFMVLEPGGRVMFLFAKSGRRQPVDDMERTTLYNAMVAYTGTVRMDGPGRFITTVDVAWNPGYNGEQIRLFDLQGDQLKIWTLETKQPQFGDRTFVADIIWMRESSGGNTYDQR
jgi:hypothetical protein